MFNCYCDLLDRNKTYAFLVRNDKENRIVCDAPDHPQVFFIGSFDRSTHLLTEGNDSFLDMPKSHNFSTLDELIDYVNSIDYKLKQGVIVYMPNQRQVKIMNPTYVSFFNVRGNESSIKFRYLQLRMDGHTAASLLYLYPEYIPIIQTYEKIIRSVSQKIYNAYVDRFIHKKYVSLPQPEYFIMQACHGWHLQDRKNNKMTYDQVANIMNSQSATVLNRIIKPYLPRSESTESSE